jgi:hypothetical protein
MSRGKIFARESLLRDASDVDCWLLARRTRLKEKTAKQPTSWNLSAILMFKLAGHQRGRANASRTTLHLKPSGCNAELNGSLTKSRITGINHIEFADNARSLDCEFVPHEALSF